MRERVASTQARARASLATGISSRSSSNSSCGAKSAITGRSSDTNSRWGSCNCGTWIDDSSRLESSAVLVDRELLECRESLVARGDSVDREHHTLCAMTALGTVHPDGLSSGDSHVPGDAEIAVGVGHESRILSVRHFHAGIGECRLGNSMVLLHERKLDNITHRGRDGLG